MAAVLVRAPEGWSARGACGVVAAAQFVLDAVAGPFYCSRCPGAAVIEARSTGSGGAGGAVGRT